MRDIAAGVGITDRAVLHIISELEEAGYLEHERVGRRNHYSIKLDKELRHPLERGIRLRRLLTNLVDPRSLRAAGRSRTRR